MVGSRFLPGAGKRTSASKCDRPWRFRSPGFERAKQFDWSELGPDRWRAVKLQIAHSSATAGPLRWAYLLQTHEMLFDAHNHAFRVLGGVHGAASDNMRTAVDRSAWQARQVNARFSAMASHFVFEPEFCNPLRAGRRVGGKNVLDMRHRLFSPCLVNSLDELNIWLEHGVRPYGRMPMVPSQVRFDAWRIETRF